MSDIANALAKARAHTGYTAAPFVTAARKPMASAPAAKSTRNWHIYRLVGATALVACTAIVLGMKLKRSTPPANQAATGAAPTIEQGPAIVGHGTLSYPAATLQVPPAGALPAGPAHVPTLASNSGAAPRPEVANRVSGLPITAVMPGAEPRFLLDGQVVHAGTKVDAELVFEGLQDGMLVFRDTRGARYGRRY